MDDFDPARIAEKIEPLKALLEARTQLANLLTYMDGKTGAEALIQKVLENPALLNSLVAQAHTGAESVIGETDTDVAPEQG